MGPSLLSTDVYAVHEAKREKERELRHALWEMRDAIDRYKDGADRGDFRSKWGMRDTRRNSNRIMEVLDRLQAGDSSHRCGKSAM